ncbi:hypothetical protein [Streptomyces sp. NPDC059991]|uniref:hypothetical protein n=1 Tax=unclassified Streptomyces TaxID=2593676 RepID=UPI0036B65CF3
MTLALRPRVGQQPALVEVPRGVPGAVLVPVEGRGGNEGAERGLRVPARLETTLAVLTANVLRISLDPEALEDLRLTDHEIEAVIEAPAEDIREFRVVLAQVLGYGRADAVPTRIGM